MTGTIACSALATQNSTTYVFQLASTGSGFDVEVMLTPNVTLGTTYTLASSGTTIFGAINDSSGHGWILGQPSTGSLSVTITSQTQTATTAVGTVFAPRGTLSATFTPVAGTGATGDVTLTATF